MGIRVRALVLATGSLCGQYAPAATYSWALPGGGSYSLGSNWSGGTVPLSSDTTIYPNASASAATISLSSNTTSRQAQFEAAGTTIDMRGLSYFAGTLAVGGTTPAAVTFSNGLLRSLTPVFDRPGAAPMRVTLDSSTFNYTGVFQIGLGTSGATGTLVMSNNSIFTSSTGVLACGGTLSTAGGHIVVETGSRAELAHIENRFGSLTVRSGGVVETEDMYGTNVSQSFDTVVDGAGSTFVHGYQYAIPHFGRQTLTVSNGGTVRVGVVPPPDVFAGHMQIGQQGGTGTVSVDGKNSLLELASQMSVGRAGSGYLHVSNGGRVISRASPGNPVYSGAGAIGRDASGFGVTTVQGSGSRWDALGELTVGREGIGSLVVSDKAIVSAEAIKLASATFSFATVELVDSGSLLASSSMVVGRDFSPFGSSAFLAINGGYLGARADLRVNESGTFLISSGQIDIHSRAMLVDYAGTSPIDDLERAVAAAHATGDWTGHGIASSAARDDSRLAIAVVNEAVWGAAPFAGEALDGTGVLLRTTYRGDANGDLAVNLDDFSILAARFGMPSNWRTGDFDYSGATNLNDFTALAANFGLVFTPGARASIPEPVGAGAPLAAALAYRFRRRRPRCATL